MRWMLWAQPELGAPRSGMTQMFATEHTPSIQTIPSVSKIVLWGEPCMLKGILWIVARFFCAMLHGASTLLS